MTEPTCERCHHPASWHRHDDTSGVDDCLPGTLDAQRGTKPLAKFRCLGYDCERPGYPSGTPETRCGCLDFVREEPSRPQEPRSTLTNIRALVKEARKTHTVHRGNGPHCTCNEASTEHALALIAHLASHPSGEEKAR